MATIKTIKKTHAMIKKVARTIPAAELGTVSMDRKGTTTAITTPEWGATPGILARAFRELPFSTLQRFVLPTDDTAPEPTKKEFGMFERRFLETIRRIYNRVARQRIEKLPRPVGRNERNRERTQLILKTVKEYEKKGWTRTAAVKQTSIDLHPCDRATIWRHLASAKKR